MHRKSERSYYRRPCAIKNPRGASKKPLVGGFGCDELVLYGIRDTGVATVSTNESGPHCNKVLLIPWLVAYMIHILITCIIAPFILLAATEALRHARWVGNPH